MGWFSWILEAAVAAGLIYWVFRALGSLSDLRRLALAGELQQGRVRSWLRRFAAAFVVCLAVGTLGVVVPSVGLTRGLAYSLGVAALAYVPIRINLWMSAHYWKLV